MAGTGRVTIDDWRSEFTLLEHDDMATTLAMCDAAVENSNWCELWNDILSYAKQHAPSSNEHSVEALSKGVELLRSRLEDRAWRRFYMHRKLHDACEKREAQEQEKAAELAAREAAEKAAAEAAAAAVVESKSDSAGVAQKAGPEAEMGDQRATMLYELSDIIAGVPFAAEGEKADTALLRSTILFFRQSLQKFLFDWVCAGANGSRESGYKGIKGNPFGDTPTLTADTLNQQICFHFLGRVTEIRTSSCVPLCKAFDRQFYVDGAAYDNFSAENCLPAWIVGTTSSAADATLEVKKKELTFPFSYVVVPMTKPHKIEVPISLYYLRCRVEHLGKANKELRRLPIADEVRGSLVAPDWTPTKAAKAKAKSHAAGNKQKLSQDEAARRKRAIHLLK